MLCCSCTRHWSNMFRFSHPVTGRIEAGRMQRRFTRMLPGFKSLSYGGWLSRLGLYSLEDEGWSRSWGNRWGKNAQSFTQSSRSRTSGHRFKVKEERFYRNPRSNFFPQKLVGICNELPAEAGTINILAVTWIGKDYNEMGQTQVSGTSIEGSSWSVWAKGPLSMMYETANWKS